MKEENKNTEDGTYRQEELALPKDIEKYAYFFEIWFLKLDKYIDAKYEPQRRRFAFRWGAILAVLFFILLKCFDLSLKNETAGMLFPGVTSILFLGVQQELWYRPRRIEQEMIKKQKYDCGCSRAGVPGYNQQFWISRRLIAHYFCGIYQIWSDACVAWLGMSAPLLLGNWLITLMIK